MNSLTVTVILATFNGERFLPDQLASLSAQTRRPDRLVLRDDGSSDRSVELVRDWAITAGVALQVCDSRSRLGPAQSFLTALRAAASADLFMFCDQDDVWLPDKIERALHKVPVGSGVMPVLYATRVEVVNVQLQRLFLSPIPRHLSFASAVCESLLTGCTMAFNAPFRELLTRSVPQQAQMHDWWCYLLATGAATLHFDPTPTLLYRQHSNNALGAGARGFAKLRSRLARFVGSDSTVRSRQLAEFAALYSDDLRPAARELLNQLLSARRSRMVRIAAAISAPIRRQTVVSALSTRIAVLTNRF